MEARYNIHEVYQKNQDKKYEIFNQWCKDNGVLIPKLEYPSFFDGGLLGVKAVKDIEHREAFLYIPMKMLLSLDYAKNHKVIGEVFRMNPHLFHPDKHEDWEQLSLAMAMFYEYQLGEESFWYPYLNLLPLDIEFFCNWAWEDIQATDDVFLMQESLAYCRDIEKEWQDFKQVLTRHPEYFHPQLIDRGLFMRIFAQVCSRCFGWGLPCTSMIPMADNLNHSHGTCVNEVINVDYHVMYQPGNKSVPSVYFTKEKFMNNYETAFTEA